KGASVIHMLHGYLGKEEFKAGLRYYLEKHAYGNTDTVDLWSALEIVCDKPVKKFMQSWTSHSGYPVIHADVETEQLTLKQERFFINPTAKQHVKTHTHWPVPLLASRAEVPDTLAKSHEDFL